MTRLLAASGGYDDFRYAVGARAQRRVLGLLALLAVSDRREDAEVSRARDHVCNTSTVARLFDVSYVIK